MLYKGETNILPESYELHHADGRTQLYLRKNITQVERQTEAHEGAEMATEYVYTFDEAHGVLDGEIGADTVTENFDIYFNICACWLPDFDNAVQEYITAVQKAMDAKAQEYGYDSIFAAVGYANSTDSVFKREADALSAWRDGVWRKCYDIVAEIRSGQREHLPSVQDVLGELPQFAME